MESLAQPKDKRQELTNGEDRLSSLPTEIIHLILSFLKSTQETVKTCLLSRRWRKLWLSSPYLFLDDRTGGRNVRNHDFKNFVNRIFLLRGNSDVHTFCLRWRTNFDLSLFEMWTLYVLMRNVKVLRLTVDICGHGQRYVDLLDHILALQSLEELALYVTGLVIPAFRPLSFCRLKILRLWNIAFRSDSLENLISGCPLLEVVCLETCALPSLDITYPGLKCLSIRSSFLAGNVIKISSSSLKRWYFVDNAYSGKLKLLLGSRLELTINDGSPSKNASFIKGLYYT